MCLPVLWLYFWWKFMQRWFWPFARGRLSQEPAMFLHFLWNRIGVVAKHRGELGPLSRWLQSWLCILAQCFLIYHHLPSETLILEASTFTSLEGDFCQETAVATVIISVLPFKYFWPTITKRHCWIGTYKEYANVQCIQGIHRQRKKSTKICSVF